MELVSEKVDVIFKRYFERTPEADFEPSPYGWERDGEPVTYLIDDVVKAGNDVATDIQQILEMKYYSHSAAEIFEETEFAEDSQYVYKYASGVEWHERWSKFQNSLTSEARFFNREVEAYLDSVFQDLDKLDTRKGKSIFVTAGPNTELEYLFRARTFLSGDKLELALFNPDKELGPPPSHLAASGRMNSKGVSTFYGADALNVAISEVRPPVGSDVAIARFKIIRPLRLLNLFSLADLYAQGSMFDPEWSDKAERVAFLRDLQEKMVFPVMPGDEDFKYLSTQAISDYLANRFEPEIDGIVFGSVQSKSKGLNVVLFQKASRVKELKVTPGATYSLSKPIQHPEYYQPDYILTTHLSTKKRLKKAIPIAGSTSIEDIRPITLDIDVNQITVCHIDAIIYEWTPARVQQHTEKKAPVRRGFRGLLDI